jgi:hypothetical protein
MTAPAALLSLNPSDRETAMGHEAVDQLGSAAVGNAAVAATVRPCEVIVLGT